MSTAWNGNISPYRERFLRLKLVLKYIEICLYAIVIIVLVGYIEALLLDSHPTTSAQLVWIYPIIVLVSLYSAVRARWLWAHTYLVANKGKVWLERPGSILFLSLARVPSLRSKSVDYFVLRQRIADLLLGKIFGLNSWTVSLDTAADEKGDLKSLKYVKDAERLRSTVHPDE